MASDSTDSTGMATHRERTDSLSSFEMDSYIKGYHEYREIWTPAMEQALKAVPEPKNVVDKYVVCVMLGDKIVGHLKKGRTGRFAKTVFYFLRADEKGSCTAIVKGKAVNLGMAKACKYHALFISRGKQNLSMYCDNSFRKTINKGTFVL